MNAILFMGAITFMVIGHLFKVKRWGLFISIYEQPVWNNLLSALALGHMINTAFPIRIGDVCRVLYSGKKFKNGYSLSLATVLADIYVDFICVSMMFLGLAIIGKGGRQLQGIARIYIVTAVLLLLSTVLGIIFRKLVKRSIKTIAGVFNEKIEFRILYVSYLTIASLKDLARKIKKSEFILYTVIIWLSYAGSYALFAEVIQQHGYYYSMSDVFTNFFSGMGLIYRVSKREIPLWSAYLFLPLITCVIISVFVLKKIDNAEKKIVYRATLPQMNKTDRMAFLKTYYKDEDRDHIQAYLDINKDVLVLEDYSAGSNAATLKVIKQGKIFYRKYAFDEDGKKLSDQVDWIRDHYDDIPLPIIIGVHESVNFFSYDMHDYSGAVGLFQYIHSTPFEMSWGIIEAVLEDIRRNLHAKNIRPADNSKIDKYINEKVIENLKIIRNGGKYIKKLEQYEEVIANGRRLKTTRVYTALLEKDNLNQIFSVDEYSDIHGDLTIENIICLKNANEIDHSDYIGKVIPQKYYFIDPNTGNIHMSPFLDYAKLLQSLHGGYEFLMMVDNISIDGNQVDFLVTKSEVYEHLYEKYHQWLNAHFNREQIKSIYCHEIVHWLRLMPYKIRKDDKTAVCFYIGLLEVLNDVWEMVENAE